MSNESITIKSDAECINDLTSKLSSFQEYIVEEILINLNESTNTFVDSSNGKCINEFGDRALRIMTGLSAWGNVSMYTNDLIFQLEKARKELEKVDNNLIK